MGRCLLLNLKSYNNTMIFDDIHSADFGIRCDSSDVNTLKLKLTSSILHNFSNDALHLNQCNTEIGNTQITNAGGNCVTIIGGHHTFTHCTIGQFYSFIGSKGIALSISNVYNQQFTPISQAFFRNCLITGYNEDDIKIVTSARYAQENINFQFNHCVLNTPLQPIRRELSIAPLKVSSLVWNDVKSIFHRPSTFNDCNTTSRSVRTPP